jgi:hypothetical protein
MLRQRFKNDQKAQSILEYTIVIGAIVLIMFAMSAMIKRGTQGMIKVVADQLGNQQNSDQPFETGGAHLENSYASTRAITDKTRSEFLGDIDYIYQDSVFTRENTTISLGFTNNT